MASALLTGVRWCIGAVLTWAMRQSMAAVLLMWLWRLLHALWHIVRYIMMLELCAEAACTATEPWGSVPGRPTAAAGKAFLLCRSAGLQSRRRAAGECSGMAAIRVGRLWRRQC